MIRAARRSSSSRLASVVAFAGTLAAMLPAASARAQNGDRRGEEQPPLPAEWMVADAPVRSPAEELATFAVAPGYRVELVASEPLVEAPVAFTFAPDGRLWVVEMTGYMRDADGAGEREPIGRIKVLSDDDGDGTMDRATVFLDGLVMPRGVALWRDGALVIEPPHLRFCRDTDGDGRADESRIVASGFAGEGNPEHAGNGLLFTLDNAFTCSQHGERFVPAGDAIVAERVPAHGQWGLSEDDRGRLYYSPNSDPLLVDLVPKRYAARNPSQRRFEGVPARAAGDMRVFPSHLTPGVNRGYQKGVLKDGRLANFTGACAPHVHDGAAMGDDMDGCAIVCEVAGNLVHRYRLAEDEGGRVVATPADGERSFWTSTDERFRPVFAAAGPDGAIYVADMYRGVIQHRIFMTSFLRAQVEARGLEAPVDAGRIWRIVPESGRPAAGPALATMATPELVATLMDPEKSRRTIARRLLVERADPVAREPLAGLAMGRAPVVARLEALWTLAGMRAADDALLAALLADAAPEMRVHALRVAEEASDSATLASFLTTAVEDGDPAVRLQAALSAGALDAPLRMPVVERALAQDLASKPMRSAVLSSLAGAEPEMLATVVDGHALADDSVAARAFAAELADAILDDGDGLPNPAVLARALASASSVAPARPWLAKAMLERVAARQRLNQKEPVQLVASCEPEGWFAMLDRNAPELAFASPIDRNLFWPGRADVSFIPPRIAKAAEMSLEEFGKRLYSNCMSCHQANGRGLPPVYPPLRGSDIVLGDPETLVKILLHGLEGKLEIDGQSYNQVMPAAPVRGDDEIAAVLTYVRSAWGNSAGAVDAALVAKVREETKGRNRSFTTKELGIAPE